MRTPSSAWIFPISGPSFAAVSNPMEKNANASRMTTRNLLVGFSPIGSRRNEADNQTKHPIQTQPESPHYRTEDAVGTLTLWVLGLLCAALAFAFGYYSQLAFRKFRDRELDMIEAAEDDRSEAAEEWRQQMEIERNCGWNRRVAAEWLWVASIAFFIWGVFGAAWTIATLG